MLEYEYSIPEGDTMYGIIWIGLQEAFDEKSKKWESFYAKSRNLNDENKIGFFFFIT